jgi:predicted phage terminase large subunit-like protein
MVKRHWVRRYGDQLPPPAEQLMTVQSWDVASKGGPDNDWSVCTTWILTRRKRCYLLDVWRRVDYPALKAAAQSLAKQWSARRVLVEDAATGTALVQERTEMIPGIIAVKPVGDKASRMAVASAKLEAGQVFLPERANWLPDLEAGLFERSATEIGICRWKLPMKSWRWRHNRGEKVIATGDLSSGPAPQHPFSTRAIKQVRFSSRGLALARSQQFDALVGVCR